MTIRSAGQSSKKLACCALLVAAAGCGGGGGGDGPVAPPAPPASGWVAGSFLPAASFAGKCVSPRTGMNPRTGLAYNEINGTATDENNWLRSWSNDLYLWYDEIVDRDPGLFTTADYFDGLKTEQKTPSGAPKDRFHFTFPTTEWLQLIQSGTEPEPGYGAQWMIVTSNPPRRVVVAYTHENSPAAAANVQRGEEVRSIDGVDINSTTQAGVDVLNDGLFPDQMNESHTFVLFHPRTGVQRSVTLQSTTVTIDTVQNVKVLDTLMGKVGYLQFNDHLATAEAELISAFETLAGESVSDLVLDLRYNGGGLLAIASEVAYMIAGPSVTAGQPFEQLKFNDKHTSINPITGGPLTPVPFFDTSSTNQPLPTLNLPRVYVLTGSMTCSASESIINGLLGVNVDVIQIGSTTCGKPYGFFDTDHCGTTYFTIQIQGVNAAGFGEYGDGFSPENTILNAGERLPGCSIRDDFSWPLGDEHEERLAAALAHRNSQTCPTPTGVALSGVSKPFNGLAVQGTAGDGAMRKSPWLTNRILEGR